jgi:hypothetical protein
MRPRPIPWRDSRPFVEEIPRAQVLGVYKKARFLPQAAVCEGMTTMKRLFSLIRAGIAVLMISGLAVGLAPGAAFAQAETPAKGSELRKTLLDAVRPMVEAEVGKPVEFSVNDLNVLGEWAFAILTPQRPGGGPIEYVYTRYQGAVDAGAFDNQVIALLRETPTGWLVYGYSLGATDVPWEEWKNEFPVPAEVFP